MLYTSFIEEACETTQLGGLTLTRAFESGAELALPCCAASSSGETLIFLRGA